ncbi:MAG: DUF4395 domain-containing protein [Actinobacteria bacterium]|nr:MAG: DUF4395 domain-containing protein [Actinomycetota bacterium]
MSKLFTFPNPVNETSARIVAGGAVIIGALFVATGNGWILAVLTYGFLARVATGPTLSPLGRLSTQLITPLLTPLMKAEHRMVPGPPKRFAQGVGATFSIVATALFVSGADTPARFVIAALVGAAFLESAFAVCLGCIMFGWLMKAGLIPEEVCQECNNFSSRSLATTSSRA